MTSPVWRLLTTRPEQRQGRRGFIRCLVACRGLFVLKRSMAIRYKVLHDGRRQILNLILLGDLIGVLGCLFDCSLYSIASLGEVTVCSLTRMRA